MCSHKFGCVSVCVMLFVFVASVESVRRDRMRNARFLSFDTGVDGDISVDLDFTIPFVKIPFKKHMESAYGSGLGFPTINVNIVGLALGAMGIMGSAVILPLLLKTYSEPDGSHRYAKLLEFAELTPETLFEFGSSMFGARDGMQGCALKVACLAAHQANGSNSIHILQQIASNDLLSKIMNTTAIDEAIQTGWTGRQCNYGCPLAEEKLSGFLSNLGFGNR